ncbi:Similar to Alpha-latroinsectotoxin-Lt1a (Fragment) (Latrodectus tredecimguttatus), partial [Cotesia congregata]
MREKEIGLMMKGANVHERIGNDGDNTDSPMGIAAFSDNVKMLKLLIKHGADINAGDDNGLTLLMKAAAEDDNSESRRFLLSQPFIEIDSLTNDKRSCLHFPGVWFSIEDIDPESSLQDLLNAGCDVNIVSNHDELPIDTYGDKEMCHEVMKKHIVKLMAAGFYVCDRNKEVVSGSELSIAWKKLGTNVHGKDFNAEDSPMGMAASANNVKMLKLLIKHGADINAGDIDDLTPLIKTTYNNNNSASRSIGKNGDPDSSLQDLLDAGCDVNIVSNDGELPIDSYEDRQKCREVMKKHIVKLMAAGFYVCDRNKEVVSGSELTEFRVECDTEVEVMKNTHGIMAGFSLFDILHKSYHKLALRIKDGDEDKFDDKMVAKFPLYAGMIKYRLEKAGQRKKFFNQVENVLYEIYFKYLPATFIHEMFFYFNNFELSKLVEI